MGFRSAGFEGKMGRSRSYSVLQETPVNLEPPPFNPARTAKRASWTAPAPCKQKAHALPVLQGEYEKGHEGGLLLQAKKGGWGAGWRKHTRRMGRALAALVLVVFVVTALLPSLSHVNQGLSPDRAQGTALSEPRVRALLSGANTTFRPAVSSKVSRHKSKSKSHGHSGHGNRHSVEKKQQLSDGNGQLYNEPGQLSDGNGQLYDGHGQLSEGDGQLLDGKRQPLGRHGWRQAGQGQRSEGHGQLSLDLTQLVQEQDLLSQGGKNALHAGAQHSWGVAEGKREHAEVEGLKEEKEAVLSVDVLKKDDGGHVAAAGWWRGFARLDDVRAELSARTESEEGRATDEETERTGLERNPGAAETEAGAEKEKQSGSKTSSVANGAQQTADADGNGAGLEVEEVGDMDSEKRSLPGATQSVGTATGKKPEWDGNGEPKAGLALEREKDDEDSEMETEKEPAEERTEGGEMKARQMDLWKAPDSKGFRPCLQKMEMEEPPYVPKGYLMVQCNGGLNQQRAAICNAVALARYLNLTLLVPYLQAHPVWNDHTKFHDLFDLDRFVKTLDGHVRVERVAPPAALGKNLKTLRSIPRNAHLDWYDTNVRQASLSNDSAVPAESAESGTVPFNASSRVIWAKPFAKRLDNNLPQWMQQSRCKANYEALRFAPEIERLGSKMSARMRAATRGRPWIAVHLRYEIDMVAYSMCNFGGGKEEQEVLHAYRMTHWDVALRRSREKRSPESQRQRGQCPLTPEEAALFLRALGFDENTHIYLATHDQQLYGGSASLAPFKALFPLTSAKADLLDAAELAALQRKASSLAALDYVMGRAADVFIPTATGNMPNLIMGHRMYDGFKKTIEPHHRKLAALLAQRNTLPWETIAERIRADHQFRDGGPSKRPKTSNFYANPSECFCQGASSGSDVSSRREADVSSESVVRVLEDVSNLKGHGFDI